jgi:phospho-N-acetylmuramoyl-pentapeptide-transferase
MALGGGLAAAAIMMKLEIILAIAGLIYVMEALSVIIQVTYFKRTGGKRIFRMAPLHHHFELGGMHETKVVRLFATITLVFCIIAFLLSVI